MTAGSARTSASAERLRQWAPLLVLAGLCVLIGFFNTNFYSFGNLVRLLNSAAIPIVLCMGATFIILMGSIDLSVEGVVALCAVIASLLVANDVNQVAIGLAAVPVALALGGAMGFANGWLHIKLKTPSFMTTLGMGFVGLGIATAILAGLTVRISDQTFRYLSLGRVFGIPMAVWIALASFIVAYVIQERTRFGRWI
ncbi:MAG TPA: ABC transporter permease, partial [Rhizobiaceae bacterium]|nr:ABC transporter permease [Rhizobiaceae bacterium]